MAENRSGCLTPKTKDFMNCTNNYTAENNYAYPMNILLKILKFSAAPENQYS